MIKVPKVEIEANEFIDFEDVDSGIIFIDDVDEESINGGLHLVGCGTGESLWANYAYNEFFLKLGRISMMDEQEEWVETHNNWYGQIQLFKVISKEIRNNNVEIVAKWIRFTDHSFGDCGSDDDIYDEIIYMIINIPIELAEQYSAEYWFRRMWNNLASYIEAITFDVENENIEEEIIEEEIEIIEEIIE